MRVAVTGGTGFIGHHLIEHLRASQAEVVALARSESAAARLNAQGASPVLGDLADGAALARLVTGAEVVWHLAGLIAARDEAEFLRANRDGTARLAAASRAAGVSRLLYLSSLAAVGPTVPGRPLDETAAAHPISAYGRSKLAGEEAVRSIASGFTVVRPPAVYGPGDREMLRVFKLCRMGLAPLLGDGTQELSLIHVGDLARALVEAATSRGTAAGLYHVAHPVVVSQRSLVAAIGRAMGRRVRLLPIPQPIVRIVLESRGRLSRWAGGPSLLSADKLPELLARAWTCSSAAFTRQTGWQAEIGLDQGLVETARWYAAEGWL